MRGVRDDQNVPEARPRQQNVFLGPLQTTLAALAAPGATTLIIASSAGMMTNDKITVMLDSGVAALCTVTLIPTTTSIHISPQLPSSAASGNIITDDTALASGNIG